MGRVSAGRAVLVGHAGCAVCHGKNNFIDDNFSLKGQACCDSAAQSEHESGDVHKGTVSECCTALTSMVLYANTASLEAF